MITERGKKFTELVYAYANGNKNVKGEILDILCDEAMGIRCPVDLSRKLGDIANVNPLEEYDAKTQLVFSLYGYVNYEELANEDAKIGRYMKDSKYHYENGILNTLTNAIAGIPLEQAYSKIGQLLL